MTYVTNPDPPPATIPAEIEGLPTTGPLGSQPALTVGGIIAVVGFVVTLLVQYFGFSISPEIKAFADEYGVMIATVLLPLITAAVTYFRVFSPHSAAEIQMGQRRS